MDLLRPTATTWDLRTLEGLWHASERLWVPKMYATWAYAPRKP